VAEGYRHDLAYIHDAGFGDWARNASGVLIRALRQNGFNRGLVVDLGCGSGILSRELADAGYSVLGIDQSADTIALAREKVPAAEFRIGSFVTAELPRAVGVAAVGEIFNYLLDEANGERALAATIARVHEALLPGGVFLFDMAGPGRVPGGGPVRTFREADDWAILVETREDAERRLVVRRHTTFRRIGDAYRRDTETHYLRLVGPEDVVPLLESTRFAVQVFEKYGDMAFPPGMAAYLAIKERG
jgi:SAM-dependent methyltransferase